MSAIRLAFLTCCAIVPLLACDTIPRPVDADSPGVGGGGSSSACTGCHGDASRSEASPLLQAAPPAAPGGRDPGAHQAHLHDGALRAALTCTECHVVPTSTAHVDGTAAVAFGPAWSAGGATPGWNAALGTCTTYCHGATLGGGPAASPAWTETADLSCGSCHGAPPPPPHPASGTCSSCHPGTVDTSGNILVAGGLHVNGTVDVGNAHGAGWELPAEHGRAANRDLIGCKACHGADLAGGSSGVSCNGCHPGGAAWQTDCTFCHGTPGRAGGFAAAPPTGTQGETATTDRAVGAHQAHLAGGGVGPAVPCSECHAVPTTLGHVDGAPAVALGALSRRSGASPAWNGGTLGCATYCHGATLAGGSNRNPTWTGGASQAACGTCHGAPPPAPAHPAGTSCGTCHAGYTATAVNPATHLDGTLQVTDPHPDPAWADANKHGYSASANLSSCRACHGADLAGGTSGVSCDTCHAGAGFADWRTNCTFCHGTQTSGWTPAQLARAAPPAGTQGETSSTARAVGAHQAHLSGGGLGPAVACSECHTVPSDLAHLDGTAAVAFGAAARRDGAAPAWSGATLGCATTYCHGGTLGGGSNTSPTWTGGASQAACGTCHGLPPPAPHSSSTACGTCHTGYTSSTVNVATHLDGTVQATGGHPAGFAAANQHGYQANRDGLASCKACHGADLAGGTSGQSCNTCHGGTAWQTNCTFCHGTPGGLASPPVDTQGLSARAQVTVGAHARHLALSWMTASSVTCATCHPARGNVVTDTAHSDGGNAEVVFAGVAAQGTASTFTRTSDTAATCATYCHGRFTGGATSASPSWVSTTAMTCTSCHGNPPSTGEHSKHVSGEGIACSTCHGAGFSRTGATTGTVAAAAHVNGTRTIVTTASGTGIRTWNGSTKTCTASCHGSETW